ncbi:hypothetical protein SANTM175S_05320 [Streptomyces antimycoticus]
MGSPAAPAPAWMKALQGMGRSAPTDAGGAVRAQRQAVRSWSCTGARGRPTGPMAARRGAWQSSERCRRAGRAALRSSRAPGLAVTTSSRRPWRGRCMTRAWSWTLRTPLHAWRRTSSRAVGVRPVPSSPTSVAPRPDTRWSRWPMLRWWAVPQRLPVRAWVAGQEDHNRRTAATGVERGRGPPRRRRSRWYAGGDALGVAARAFGAFVRDAPIVPVRTCDGPGWSTAPATGRVPACGRRAESGAARPRWAFETASSRPAAASRSPPCTVTARRTLRGSAS